MAAVSRLLNAAPGRPQDSRYSQKALSAALRDPAERSGHFERGCGGALLEVRSPRWKPALSANHLNQRLPSNKTINGWMGTSSDHNGRRSTTNRWRACESASDHRPDNPAD